MMPKQQTDAPNTNPIACAFCGSTDDKLVTGKSAKTASGPNVFICRDCVGLCIEAMADKDPEWREKKIEALTALRRHG